MTDITQAAAPAPAMNAIDTFFSHIKADWQIFEGDVISLCQNIEAGVEVAAEDLQYCLSWLGNHIGEVAQTVSAVQNSVTALSAAGIPIPGALTTGIQQLNDAVAGVNAAMNNQTVATDASTALTEGYKATKALQIAAASAAGLAAAIQSTAAPPVTMPAGAPGRELIRETPLAAWIIVAGAVLVQASGVLSTAGSALIGVDNAIKAIIDLRGLAAKLAPPPKFVPIKKVIIPHEENADQGVEKMNGFINALARLGGVPQETLDKVQAASPAAAELVSLAKDNQPLIQEIGDLYIEAKPLLDRAVALYIKAQPLLDRTTPLVALAWADIEKILPAAQEVLAFINAPAVPVPSADDIRNQQGSGPT